MKDLLGKEIQRKDVVAFANNSGWLALAVVVEVDEKSQTLRTVKRGFKNYPQEKQLMAPNDVLIVTDQVTSVEDPASAGRPEEVEFINKLFLAQS